MRLIIIVYKKTLLSGIDFQLFENTEVIWGIPVSAREYNPITLI